MITALIGYKIIWNMGRTILLYSYYMYMTKSLAQTAINICGAGILYPSYSSRGHHPPMQLNWVDNWSFFPKGPSKVMLWSLQTILMPRYRLERPFEMHWLRCGLLMRSLFFSLTLSRYVWFHRFLSCFYIRPFSIYLLLGLRSEWVRENASISK